MKRAVSFSGLRKVCQVIDNCPSTFEELATVVLPSDMDRLHTAMRKSHTLTEFCVSGDGVKTILRRLGRTHDFSGL